MTMLGVPCSSVAVALLLLLCIICAVSEGVRYRIKFLIFAILCMISATWSLPLMFFHIGDWRNGLIPAWGTRKIGKLFGINFQVRGMENVSKKSGSVVLINHQSSLDLCVLAELWPVLEKGTVIAKKEVFYLGPFGLATWLWGTIFINRSKVEEARDIFNSTAEIVKKKKANLMLFPEGKRHSGRTLLPFKKGAFHVAVASQLPIQPVVVSRYYFLNDKFKRFDSGSSFVTILPAISTENLTKEDIPDLLEKTYEIMNKAFQECSQEALSQHMESLKTE